MRRNPLMTRRSFAAGALATAAAASHAQTGGAKIPIAVQLYSVRQIAEKDLPGVLQAMARSGYKGVEFAGYYGHTADAIRRMLDQNKLRVAGTHIGLESLLGAELIKTVAFNKAIGNRNLIVPGFASKYHASTEAWKQAARLLDEAARKVRGDGFIVGYHNHDAELRPGSRIALDVFFETAPNVKVQVDLGHVARAGVKPEDVVRKYRGRVVSVHVKEFSPGDDNAELGKGVIQWNNVFRELDTSPGMEWLIVEEEGSRCERFTCVDRALQILTKQMNRA